jgi:hypothetical protein
MWLLVVAGPVAMTALLLLLQRVEEWMGTAEPPATTPQVMANRAPVD